MSEVFEKIFKKQPRYLIDEEDHRDYIFSTPHPTKLPEKVDLRKYTPQIEYQGHLASCTANAGVNALEILLYKAGKFKDLSRLFLYWIEREPYPELRGKDIGAYLRDVYKQASKYGICWEEIWPYIESNVNVKPSNEAYEDAAKKLVKEYRRIVEYLHKDDYAITATKIALAQGYPVIIGMEITKDFLYIKGSLEKHDYRGTFKENAQVIGGHAMCIVGYDDKLGGFIVENSWGKNWGDGGFFLLKYDVALKDIHDAWVCTKFWDIAFKPEWERGYDLTNYDTIELNLDYEDISDLGNGFTILESTVSGGIKPFKYKWKFIKGILIYKDKIYPIDDGKKCKVKIGYIHEPWTWIYCCQVTDSGEPPYRVRQYFKLHIDPFNYSDKLTLEKFFLAYLKRPATSKEINFELTKFRELKKDLNNYLDDFLSRKQNILKFGNKDQLIKELVKFLYSREATDEDIKKFSEYSIEKIPYIMVFEAVGLDLSIVKAKANIARMVTNVLIRENLDEVDENILKYPIEHYEDFKNYQDVKNYIIKQIEIKKKEHEKKKEDKKHKDKPKKKKERKRKKIIPIIITTGVLILFLLIYFLTK